MQGWQVSPHTVKTKVFILFFPIWQKYFLPWGEMAERGETKIVENLHENTQLVEIILYNYCFQLI